MQCPVDGTNLVITDRQGVEIDYCPQCRGVWLDRGELDKVIDRMNSAYGPGQRSASPDPQHSRQQYDNESRPAHYERRDYDDDDDYHGRRDSHHGKPHKKEGFLGDLFDF